uniref:M20_dimer domain-containing protein n=1 Tax=Steinernema glaseri TaxID=37863 RepID=A0A1I7ZH42_9BILA
MLRPLLLATALALCLGIVSARPEDAKCVLKPASDSVQDLLVEMIKIESISGNEPCMGNALVSYLELTGWIVKTQLLESQSGRFNILATRKEVTGKGPKFLFNSHFDTVPPFIAPSVDEQNVYGRGSNDAKGQLAAMIKAAERLVKNNPEIFDEIGLLFVVGEEVDHIGMIEANKLNLQPDYLIVGEPSEMKFALLQKGVVKLIIKAHGKAAHSGYPHMGVSAIEKLLDILDDLRHHNWPSDKKLGDTTMNIGLIKGGQAMNALAAEAQASIMFRVTESATDIQETVKQLVAGRADIEFLGYNDPVILSEPPKGYPTDVVAYNTDLPYFEKRDKLKGAFLFGPGSITSAHSMHEFMPIKELEEAVTIYADLARSMLSS